MDFRQSSQPGAARTTTSVPVVAPEQKEQKQSTEKNFRNRKLMNLINGILLISIAVIIGGVAFSMFRAGNSGEHKYVQNSKYQAVFLNNGQVYFGKVQTLNNQFVRLTSVYYLTQSGDTTSSNYSLVKLGCQQIHDPLDEMVINRSQVTFWENLQDNGKVVTSIKQFQKQNPNGPDCSQVSNQTQASGTSTQGTSGGTGTSTTGSGTSTTGTGTATSGTGTPTKK